MGRTVVGHPSQSGNVVTFPLLLALIADASSASSSWSFPSLSAAPASRSGGRVARREFLPNGRYSIHTCRPRHVVSTAALAEEESLEPTADPSSLRGTADIRVTRHNSRRSTSNSPCRPAATSGCRVLAYLCPPRARSSVCRQIVSGKSSRLSHVRPEMKSWGAPPRSNTENSTGPTPTPGSAFRKGLHQPSAESPALPPGVYRGSRRR